MPIFDFICKQCGHKFDLMISNSEKDKVRCPECGAEVKQMLSSFNTGGSTAPMDSCQGCAAARGGG